jgi:hypothetical protein
MKQTMAIGLGQFRDAFHKMGRGEQFSYEAQELLFDWFEEVNPDYDLDVIEVCCDFAEMTLEEVIEAYDLEDDTTLNEAEQWLNEETAVCGKTNQDTFVFQQF